MAVELRRHRFTVDEYYKLAEIGVLPEDARVELLSGDIVKMAPISPLHASVVLGLNALFGRRFSDVALVNVQNPLRLDDLSEPQPDVMPLKPQADLYRSRLPNPTDVYLLIEVADTSAQTDLRLKVPLYACAGVPEVWLLNLNLDAILVHRDPSPDGYRTVQTLRRGDRLAPLAFPEREQAVDDLLG